MIEGHTADTIFDIERAVLSAETFLRDCLAQSHMAGYVVGLSGGIDSALSTTLASRAVGQTKVLGVLMPYRTSSENSITDATELAGQLGIEYRTVDISPMIDAYYSEITDKTALRAGNKMARERMSILFDIAHEANRLVLGTGNRTEICLGYTTWYGDAACSVNPIGQLYKTEVRTLSRNLGVPQSIIDKPPSADLWVGQTDEGEIGITYETIDRLLRRLIDDGITSRTSLKSEGFATSDIDTVVSLLNKNSFKRALPQVASLGRAEIPQTIELQP
ncbi:MAG: NAD+ synthase [Candidatus Zixiibacteriota bacterium]